MFACLTTNCTRLSHDSTSLAKELTNLPIFSICNPNLRWLYNPIADSKAIGLMYLGCYAYFAAIVCIFAPIYNSLTIKSSPPLEFVFCPNVTINSIKCRLKELIQELKQSNDNHRIHNHKYYLMNSQLHDPASASWFEYRFCQPLSNHIESSPTDTCLSSRDITTPGDNLETQTSSINQKDSQTARHDDSLVNDDHQYSYVFDCLPINTTQWWHKQLVSNYVIMLNELLFSCAGLNVIYHFYLYLVINSEYREMYSSYDEFVRSNGCALWTNDDKNKTVKIIDFVRQWNSYHTFEATLILVIPCFILAITVASFYLMIIHIKICFYELKMQLKLAMEYSRLSHVLDCSDETERQLDNQVKQSSRYLMKTIRNETIRRIHFKYHIIWLKRLDRINYHTKNRIESKTELDSRLAYQEFILDFLDQLARLSTPESWLSLQLRIYIELLEKIQLNYWYFAEYLRQFDAVLSTVLLYCCIINFGFSLISVYFYRRIKDFVVLPLIMTMIATGTINGMIGWVSTVHSDGLKMTRLFWSLVSFTTGAKNEQIIHLRSLWVKQLKATHLAGGLALKVFGVNVTYVGIIELFFWTATVLLFAYTRY